MNLPNKLTVFRIILVPVFMVLELTPFSQWHLLYALAVFAIASLTDLADGKIARKNNMITDFGKFMDPIADKLLVTAALVGFVQLGYTNAWIVMIIIAREFLVSSLRMMASGKGTVIAANLWGKAKTVSQMVSIIIVLLLGGLGLPLLPGSVCLWIAAALTVVSGVQYLLAYSKFIDVKG